MYCAHFSCPITADPIASPSRILAALRAVVPLLGMDFPREASAAAAVAWQYSSDRKKEFTSFLCGVHESRSEPDPNIKGKCSFVSKI